VVKTLLAVSAIPDAAKVIQIKGRNGDLAAEACAAAAAGADVIFIDTGNPDAVRTVSERLGESGLRRKVKIAFGGGVSSADVPELVGLDIDILDIGRQIVDAPLLDMRMEIIETHL
jgi:nicotinate-nucleotide pyrophosphorylase (carboxylating)